MTQILSASTRPGMALSRVARFRLLGSCCLLENGKTCFREIALFPVLLLFRFALRFWHTGTVAQVEALPYS